MKEEDSGDKAVEIIIETKEADLQMIKSETESCQNPENYYSM